ncbi:MAG: cyclic di-GMP phosphodiesterase [Clostridiales bacterium]|nr:cyclic di-GMP phosphodiesterase [Clostridiales bacterium]
MRKILSVDDSVSTLTLVRETLREDYKVFVVTSGEEALSFLEKQKPDLILLDFYMIGLDGLETLEKMNEREDFDIPVIMLTSISTKPLEDTCRQLGAVAFLPKPFDPEVLKKMIADVFEG